LVAVKIPLVVALGRTGPGADGLWVALPLGEGVSALAALVVLRQFGPKTSRTASEPVTAATQRPGP